MAELKSQQEETNKAMNEILKNQKAEFLKKIEEQAETIRSCESVIAELRASNSNYETKNKELSESNIALSKTLKDLQVRVNHIQEQYIIEQKNAQSALTSKILIMESKHQKEIKELKNNFAVEKQKTVDFFLKRIGDLYGITGLDYDEQSLIQLFAKLQSDLSKLKYFQDQAIKL